MFYFGIYVYFLSYHGLDEKIICCFLMVILMLQPAAGEKMHLPVPLKRSKVMFLHFFYTFSSFRDVLHTCFTWLAVALTYLPFRHKRSLTFDSAPKINYSLLMAFPKTIVPL